MDVRWDAVVEDKRFWSEPVRAAPVVQAGEAIAPLRVHLWLFGSLADAIAERPLTLEFQGPFAVDDVIAELGRRCGPEFLSKLTTSGGGPVRHCRVYLDGEEIEDTAATARIGKACAQMEMILLTAAEGG